VGRRDVDRYRVRARVLALVAPNGTRRRVRLLTMAVVDDLVALVVIATLYTDHVSLVPLGDLAQRAAAVPAAPVHELRDRALVRAR